ncbi:MAG: SurA N-terminal domain-containing protein [Oleiphilaceae bacterium]|nr:SurA N-terminal domain-containing protein [Oleiphilaceae bacterium]
MLQDIRDNAQGMIAKTIIVVLILSLSIWGMDAIVGGFGGEPEVATVSGEPITEREFQRRIQIERQQRLAQMDRPDPSRIDQDELRSSVLEGLIQQKLLELDVQERGLEMSEQDVDRMITEQEAFQVDGRFSPERFRQAVRNQGMTVEEFRQAIKRDQLTQLVRAVVSGSAFSTQDEASHIASLFTQTRTFSVLEVPFEQVADRVGVTDQEIVEYYEANQDEFKRPERADVAWIELNIDNLVEQVEVDESDVRELYQRRVEQMESRAERNAAHILISDGEGADETVQTVAEALDEGRDFAELAREYSDDSGSAEQGGELGFATPDSYDEAFSEALFDLEAPGDVVGPVTTQFGRHFIKLLDVESPEIPSFAEMEEELRREAAREKAGRLFAEKSVELAELAYAEYDLEAPAELINADIQTRDGVTRENNEPPFDHPGLIREIFSDEVLKDDFNTEPVEIDQDRAIVARVREYHPAAQLELAEVRDRIRDRLRSRKLRDTLESEAGEYLATLRDQGEAAMDDLADSLDAQWQRHESVDRNSQQVSAVVREAVFAMPRPPEEGSYYDSVAVPGGVALVKLDKVTSGDEMATQMLTANMRDSLAQRHGQAAYAFYVEQLRQQAEIDRQ